LALPQQLKSARMNTAMLGNTIPAHFGELETAIANIFGFTIDTNITASAMTFDNSGRITKNLVEQKAAGPVGWRFRNSSNNKEMRIAVVGTNLDFDENTGTEGTPAWTNRFRIAVGTGALTGQTFSASSAGLAPVSDGSSSKYLSAAGTYTVPAAVTATSCRIRNSATQNVTNGTFTALNFDTEDWDSGSMHSGGNPSRITFPTAGKYVVVGMTGFSASAAGRRILDVRDGSGTTHGRGETTPNPTPGQTFASVSAIVDGGAGTYVELVAWQNSGGTLTTITGASHTPQFSAYKIGG
jgi:hypothetical protein